MAKGAAGTMLVIFICLPKQYDTNEKKKKCERNCVGIVGSWACSTRLSKIYPVGFEALQTGDLTEQKCFWWSEGTSCPLHCVQCLLAWYWDQRTDTTSSLHPPFRYLCISLRSLRAYSPLNNPSSLSLSLWDRCFNPLIILVASHWT